MAVLSWPLSEFQHNFDFVTLGRESSVASRALSGPEFGCKRKRLVQLLWNYLMFAYDCHS
jgi:hypothetical protein